MTDIVVNKAELARRTIRREDLVSCNEAFIDCRTPGSDKKENYSIIGAGVTQSAAQVINLEEQHGYNIGAAAMPNGVTNNLHLHFTAEVFLNFRGDWLFRWGVDGKEGEYVLHEGDIISVPTWIFRGFTNVGVDDGFLFTALGQDDTGGIIWGPSVLKQAEQYGLYLSADKKLIDTHAGDPLPEEDHLVRPMTPEQTGSLRHYSAEEMRARITTPADRRWSSRAFLCTGQPGGNAELATVIGYGMTEDRDQEPRVFNPHGLSLAWLRAEPGEGMLRHRHAGTQAMIVRSGTWEVTFNTGEGQLPVTLGAWDTLSVPANAWRTIRNTSGEAAEMVVVASGDARVRLEWAPEVVDAAAELGLAYDANGYLAPAELVAHATQDD